MLGAAGRWPSHSEPAVVSMVWMRRSSYESRGSGLRLLWTVGPQTARLFVVDSSDESRPAAVGGSIQEQ